MNPIGTWTARLIVVGATLGTAMTLGVSGLSAATTADRGPRDSMLRTPWSPVANPGPGR